MIMTENEIKRSWRNRDLKDKEMIKCLAELNCCGETEIIEYCEAIGIVIPEKVKNKLHKRKYINPWTEEEERILFEKRALGYMFKDIAYLVGRSENACACHFNEYKWRYAYDEG